MKSQINMGRDLHIAYHTGPEFEGDMYDYEGADWHVGRYNDSIPSGTFTRDELIKKIEELLNILKTTDPREEQREIFTAIQVLSAAGKNLARCGYVTIDYS